jgi:hypothetical protein
MRLLFIICILGLAGCVESYNVERSSTNLHTEAEDAFVSYVWDQELFTIELLDTKKDLLELQIIPGTACIWNDAASYRLTPNGRSYNGSSGYDPKMGKVRYWGFYMKLDNPHTKKEHLLRPLNPGAYSISVQFNGVSGVYTLCGSFRIVKKSEPYHDGLR